MALLIAPLLAGCATAGPRATVSNVTTTRAAATPAADPRPTVTQLATPQATVTQAPAGPATVRHARHVPRVGHVRRRTGARFRYSARSLSALLRRQLERTSWHPGCPVSLDQLRYVRIAYWGFDRRAHLGEMVVNARVVVALRQAFATLFAARFPIRRMRLVDRYGGSDYASIQADNTSAFNCRDATGSSRWSEHASGLAIDINPIENPYVYTNNTTTHPASDPYLDRSIVRPGMAVTGGTLVRAFAAIGWGWGGHWPRPTDYQHFSVNGR